MATKFNTLDLDSRLIKNLDELDYLFMTPIQQMSLPLIIEGKDVIAKAKTGSGKTAAFSLGFLNVVDVKQTRPQALILCPTRELAEQVAMETRRLARQIPNVKVLTITGGKSEYHQEKSLAHGAHIIVGTPGRVLKLLKRKILTLDQVNYYVLDEADRMLDMGFSEDIFKITSHLPRRRQTLLFSATFPENIEDMSQQLQFEAQRVSVDTTHEEKMIEEEFFQLESHKDKLDLLLDILGTYQPERFIVFCKTKRISDSVAMDLYKEGVIASSIHGDLDQFERTKTLTKFSNKSLSGIVATDVAARGIDIKGLDLVVNFDLPNDPEVYVHRIGRTGRAGEQGRAVSFLVNQELDHFERILEYQAKDHDLKDANVLNTDSRYELKPPMKSLFIRGGKKDKLRPGDIVGAIVGESGVESSKIGDIAVTNMVTYVAIENEVAEHVCERLNSGKIKKRKFKVGLV